MEILIDNLSYSNLKRVLEELYRARTTRTVPEKVWALLTDITILEPVIEPQLRRLR